MPPDRFTLSQRVTAKRLFLWFAIVAMALMCAMVATAQDAGAGMKAGHTEAIMKKDEFDAIFMGKLFQVLIVLASLGLGGLGVHFVGKRKPSMDEDISGLKKDVVNVQAQQSAKIKAMEDQLAAHIEALEAQLATKLEALEKQHAAKIETLEGQNRLLFKKVDQVSDHLTRLSTGQATNTANIGDIKATAHNIQLGLASLNSHILELSRETRKPR